MDQDTDTKAGDQMPDFAALADRFKIPMMDLDPPVKTSDGISFPNVAGFDRVELKMDGWFTLIRIKQNCMQYITSSGDVRKEVALGKEIPDAILVGEWIYGTNWAKSRADIFGQVFVHNIVSYRGKEIVNLPYDNMRSILPDYVHLLDPRIFVMIPGFEVSMWQTLWTDMVLSQNYEGLVFKNATSAYFDRKPGRMKKVASMDYVVMGFVEGKGRLKGTLGAIEGGLFVNGILTKVCTVGGGFSDYQRYKIWNDKNHYYLQVMRATGKSLFPSGALRHPAFDPFSETEYMRPDKKASQCTLEQNA